MVQTTTLILFVIAALTVQQAQPPALPPPPPNGAITGTVINGATGDAVPGALVQLLLGPGAPPIPRALLRQITDERGRFAFVQLPGEATFTITASKPGYLDAGASPDTTPNDARRRLTLRADEWIANVKVPVWPPSAISGVVRDERGEPVVGVFVRALSRFRLSGREELAPAGMTITNDRGEYRLAGLTPGRYLVQVPSVQAAVPPVTKMAAAAGNAPDGVMDVDDSARLVIGRYPLPPPSSGGRPLAYPPAFHPSAALVAQATTLDLGHGEHRAGIDVGLAPVPCVRVSGVVEGPVEALTSLTLRLLPAGLETLGLGSETATVLVGGDGRFTFVNVPAGTYTLDAPTRLREFAFTPFRPGRANDFPIPPPAQGWGMSTSSVDQVPGLNFVDLSFRGGASAEYSGRASITVGATDVTGLVLRLRPHATLTGREVVELDPAQPAVKPPARFSYRLDPAGGEAHLGQPSRSFQDQSTTGEFSIPGILPGQYYVRLVGATGWLIKSITWKGADYTQRPLDADAAGDLAGVVVTVTNAVPQLTGTVRGSDDVPVEDAVVVAFPANPSQWRNAGLMPERMRTASLTNAGAYMFRTLPAGDYFIVGIDRARLRTWREPDVLAQLARAATRVTLTWGGRTNQDVPAVVIR